MSLSGKHLGFSIAFRFGQEKGFTLIELIVVLTIFAVLVTLAAPSFRNVIVTQRVKVGHF